MDRSSDQLVVVIGGNAAGMSAASQLRRLKKNVPIRVFEKGRHTSFSACGFPYYIAGLVDEVDSLVARTPEEFRAKYDIDVQMEHEVLAIDTNARSVRVKDLRSGEAADHRYAQLVISTGAIPVRPKIENIEAEGVFGVQTMADILEVQCYMEKYAPQKVVIVGGGYIGLEMAEALNCHKKLDVTIVDRSQQVMGTLDADMAAGVADALRDVGITLRLGETLERFETKDGRVSAVVTDKGSLPVDMVVLGLGVRPNSRLAAEAGLRLGPKDSVWVDAWMRTSAPDVFAAGDCVQTINLVSGRPFHFAMGTMANKQGRVVGLNLAGESQLFPGALGTAVCQICSREIARTGLLEREAAELKMDYRVAKVTTYTKAGYYPEVGEMEIKLVVDAPTRRLLGAQIVGACGSAKRIDTVAVAMTMKATVDEILDFDLSYAPPFSEVWDPVQTACRRALHAL